MRKFAGSGNGFMSPWIRFTFVVDDVQIFGLTDVLIVGLP